MKFFGGGLGIGGGLALGREGPTVQMGGAVGAAVGLLGWFIPQALDGGQRLVDVILQGQIPLLHMPGGFLLRFGLTMLSYGCGAPGGLFAPLLVLGALLGFAVGDLAHLLLPGTIASATPFAVVGMAAYFAAIVRAPLTGIVLIVNWSIPCTRVLPLWVSRCTTWHCQRAACSLPCIGAWQSCSPPQPHAWKPVTASRW